MSILSEAFQHALDARERVVGIREKIIVGETEVDALVETNVFAPEAIAGGIADSNTFLCQVAQTALVPPPEIGVDIQVRGRVLQLLEVQDINEIVYGLLVGDASYE